MEKTKINNNAKLKIELPIVRALVSTLYIIPTYVVGCECPHCDVMGFTEVHSEETGQTILTQCTICEKDFSIQPQQKR